MADSQTVEQNAQGQNQEDKTITLIITRQENDKSQSYDEKFVIPYRPNMNVIAALMEIQRNPVNSKGEENDTCDMGYELS